MNARVLLATVVFIFLAGMHQSAPRAAEEDARLNLRDAELPAFIELVARITGRNFIVDPRVRGTVTVIAPEPMTPDTIYTIFLNVLQINGYAIVEGDGADRIVPVQMACQLPPRVEGQAQGPARAAGFVTRVVKVENMPLDEAMEVIRPLLPAEAALSAYRTGRLLILSDREANIARIEELLARLDRPRLREVEVLVLRNAAAGDVVNTLAALELAYPDAKVTADDRSNALLVSGAAAFREQVRRLATELDRPRNITDATVVRLRYADAAKIETVISKLFNASSAEGQGSEAVVADVTTNSILISAPPDRLSSLVAAVNALDQRPSQVLVEGVIFEMGAEKVRSARGAVRRRDLQYLCGRNSVLRRRGASPRQPGDLAPRRQRACSRLGSQRRGSGPGGGRGSGRVHLGAGPRRHHEHTGHPLDPHARQCNGGDRGGAECPLRDRPLLHGRGQHEPRATLPDHTTPGRRSHVAGDAAHHRRRHRAPSGRAGNFEPDGRCRRLGG